MRASKYGKGSICTDTILITTEQLMMMLNMGRPSAVNIGNAANAKVNIGRRVLWNREKISAYVNAISG